MRARLLALATLLAAVVTTAAPFPSHAQDPAAAPLSKWARASDEERAAGLEAVVAAPSRESVDALVAAARLSLVVTAKAAELRSRYASRVVDPAANAKMEEALLDAERSEVERVEKNAVRETAALDRLASAAGRVLDAMSESEAVATEKDLLRAAPDAALDGFRAFIGRAVGASRLQRTVVVLIDTASETRREIGKLVKERAEPARKLEEVIRKFHDAVDRYLEAARKKGDDSGQVPSGLVGTLPEQQKELEKIVQPLANAIDAADDRRRTAREALARILGGSNAADVDRILDLVDARLLRADDVDDRAFGLLALGPASGSRALAILEAAAEGKDPRLVAVALDAMGDRQEPEVVGLLGKRLVDDALDWRVRASAAASLARTGRKAAVPVLIEGMKGAKGRLVDDVRTALIAITGERFAAAEAPWRAWWDIAGDKFLGPADPKPPAAPGAPPAGKPAGDVAAKGDAAKDDGFQFYGIESHSTRVLFVLDFSGSMNWPGSARDEKTKKIDVLRREMKKSLVGLPDGAVFNAVAFSSDVRVWKKEPQVRSSKTAAEALLWVEKMPVDGGTNIGDALETAFRLMGAGVAKDRTEPPAFDTVFFMTDGKPSVGKTTGTKQILAAVRRWNEGRKVRLHVVGMGGHKKADPPKTPPPGAPKKAEEDIDVEFLKALAEQNGGQCLIR